MDTGDDAGESENVQSQTQRDENVRRTAGQRDKIRQILAVWPPEKKFPSMAELTRMVDGTQSVLFDENVPAGKSLKAFYKQCRENHNKRT